MRKLLALTSVLLLSGCNLAMELDDYPYEGPLIIEDMGEVGVDADMGRDMRDMGETRAPRLRFTELLPQATAEGNQEFGEYIEVTNVGTVPADPKRIVIQFMDAEERVDTQLPIKPPVDGDFALIEPGHSFMFLRRERDDRPIAPNLKKGSYYIYGDNSTQFGLSNSARRLSLRYLLDGAIDPTEQDQVVWVGGHLIDPVGPIPQMVNMLPPEERLAIQRNVAWSLNPNAYATPTPSKPSAWCYDPTPLAQESYGSPGAPFHGICRRERPLAP